jgi:hypothetical protein
MSKVYIVHCIDTEGPLYESLDATFERLSHIHHVDIEPSHENLEKLQKGEIDLGDRTTAIQKMLDPDLLEYNDTWGKIQEMLDDCLSPGFRNKVIDSTGKGWVYNWFCADFVNFDNNPRRRCMGYHNIFDYYNTVITDQDSIHFHYHPHGLINNAHISATNWFRTDSLEQILCRRIIDRGWFPVCNRPGFQVNRPDSHWFLEQYIPFDYSNMAIEPTEDDKKSYDFSGGRSGDWRRAPRNWYPYHPSYDDYQKIGLCRRWITRCLNIGTRSYNINQKELDKAFVVASRPNIDQIVSFANHDFRDIRKDISHFRDMLGKSVSKYPNVEFVFSDPLTPFREMFMKDCEHKEHCNLELESTQHGTDMLELRIESNIPIFGPQPYLAIKTHSGQYFHDNLDIHKPFRKWSYTFDRETLPIKAVESIGIAANTPYGKTTVVVLHEDERMEEVYHRN